MSTPVTANSPLGVFDSGVGGLTVVRALRDLLPNESIVYLGDTARVPYGSKSPDTIRRFSMEDTQFLVSHGVKAVVVACNTATAHALPVLQATFRVPVIGVLGPGVEATLSEPNCERVGIIGTAGVSLFPFVLPSSSDPRSSLTVWDSVSSHLTLGLMLGATAIFLPLIVVYTSWAYSKMSGKVTEAFIRANDKSAY